jgi:short subunit dehydrogenase-like uncharacterized protein
VTTVGLLGATGYTGRLVAAELARREVTTRLGGRDPARLAALERPPSAETFVVDTTDPKRLALFLASLDAVISCVGPFADLGGPVVDAAVGAGVPYVDSSGETSFVAGVYERHADAPVPVVPACGFEYALGDLAAALAAERAGGEVTDVDVGYQLHRVRPSRGTARSALGILAAGQPASRRVVLEFPDGRRPAVTLGWGEQLTVPRHLPGARVRTAVVLPAPLAYAAGLAGPLVPYTAPLLRWARPLLGRVVDRMPEGPPEASAARSSAVVVARACGPHGAGAVTVTSGPAYPVTAVLLVEAALRVADGNAPTGALTPAQAFDARGFLDAVSGPLLAWRESVEQREPAQEGDG